MKTVGVITEYNPFHNGHAYHLQEAKKQTGADVVVAVMSGYFLQRGEPALVSKWARTKMALAAGADVVIELPYAFATQKADVFAGGALSILDALNVDALCFGSENGDIEAFKQTAHLMQTHEEAWNEAIRQNMKQGLNYPKAASLALESLTEGASPSLSFKPNNILGLHYVNEAMKRESPLTLSTIERLHADYHSEDTTHDSIASATSIRKKLNGQDSLDSIEDYVPESTYNILMDYKEKYHHFHTWSHFFPYLQYRILTDSLQDLQNIYEMEEGLEYRLHQQIKKANAFDSFMEHLQTKRYTRTRLQRLLTHVLTGTRKETMKKAEQTKEATYIRLLGMTARGKAYMNEYKKTFSLPVISTVSRFSDPYLDLDLNAANVYALSYDPFYRQHMLHYEFTTPPIILEGNKN